MANTPTGAPQAEPPYPPLNYASYVVGVLLIAYLLAYLDRQILSLLVDDLRHALQISDTQLSLLQGLAFALFFAIAGLPIGRLVDHTNRRNVLIAGIVTWTGATFACGMAQTFGQFFVARLMVGAGEACLAPAALSIVADYFAPSNRGKANGVMLAGSAIGIAISSMVGGLILKALNAAGGGLTVPLLGHLETWRAVLVLAAAPGIPVALLLCTLKEPVRRGASNAAGARAEPARFWAYMRQHWFVLSGISLAFGLCSLTGYGIISWAPMIFMRVHHMSAGDVGVILGLSLLFVNSFAAFAGGLLADVMNQRFRLDGRLRTMLIVIPIMMGFLALFAASGSPWITVVAYAGASAPTAALNAICFTTLYDVVPNELRGQVVAAHMLLITIVGLGLSPTLVALATDYVFRDDDMVQFSILLVGMIASTAAIGLILAVMQRYRALRSSVPA